VSGVEIRVNGERQELTQAMNVIELLKHLGLRADRVAIERNMEILPKREWDATRVAAGDSFEIVQLVGGG
jgi:thiamine biosynthesis protein ThiS